MGLSGNKNRTKIGDDPNNTHWSQSTNRLGHKLLTAQGWTPGGYLGAKDANHAEHYTVASASHIKVVLRPDNLGLGAKRGNQRTETFGLDAFQGLLGRLNGKTEEQLEKEENVRSKVKLVMYNAQRGGSIQFVHGGYLLGEKIEKKLVSTDVSTITSQTTLEKIECSRTEPEDQKSREASKKRKRSEKEVEQSKKSKKSKRSGDTISSSSEEGDLIAKKAKKDKRKKRKESDVEKLDSGDAEAGIIGTSSLDEKAERKRKRLEKRTKKEAKREAKRLKKERRRKEKSKSKETTSDSSSEDDTEDSSAIPEAKPCKVVQSTIPTPSFSTGRHAVRQRNIQQKRRACMDPQALREIFMIKAKT